MSKMNEIKHHLTDELLMAYSAGELPEAFSLVVATHISLCDDCRAALDALDCVGGALLENDSVAMSDDALAATMKLIAGELPKPISAPNREDAVFPKPLQDYVGGDLAAVNWTTVGMGVRQAILKTSKDASVRLLHIPAGSAVPDHGHRGTELTLVLKGAFRDENDRFGRGDLEVANEDMQHTPIAEMGEDCICLAATDAPLKFNGLLPRIAQPFLRI